MPEASNINSPWCNPGLWCRSTMRRYPAANQRPGD